MRTTLILSLPLLLAPLMAVAQNNTTNNRQVTLSAGVEAGIPLGEFDDSWGREVLGFSGSLAVPMSILPFDWGFDFGWGRMGGNEQEVPINEQHIAATTGELRINSDIFSYHGLLRLKPFNGKVSPYIEGLAGIRQFTTRTRIHVEGMDSPYVDQRNANEFIWSHGWAAGLQIAPARHFYVEGRVERLNGGKVSYVDPTSIDISPEGVVTYGTLTSGVRVVNIHLGIGLRF